MTDEKEIRRAIAVLHPDNAPFEIRLIDGKWNMSGYFSDADMVISELTRIGTRRNMNAYITLNRLNPECSSRKQRGRLTEFAAPTTGDNDVAAYDWLMIDIDSKRAAGTSASASQLTAAKEIAAKVYYFLRERGWAEPVKALSGNGVHLLYSVGLNNTPDNVKLMQNCLLALSMAFTDDKVEIDLKTFNPSRITKLYGTMAQKGANTPERPHRMSKIVSCEKIEQIDIAMLKELAALLPQEEKPAKYNNFNPREFDLESWIHKNGLRVQKQAWNGGAKWVFEECPFDSSHTGKDAAIIQTPDGKICFNCFHNSCAGHRWHELRLKYEPDAYDKKYISNAPSPNYKKPSYEPPKIREQNGADGAPVFYTIEQIRKLKTPPEVFIKTGVNVIDSKMRGLKKGFVSCVSGLRGSGKSSLISQFAIEAADQGYKTALFSGELTAKHLCKWLTLQAAGSRNVRATQYENYYQVEPAAENAVSEWLNDKVYVYNNDYGNNFSDVYSRLNECVAEYKVDLVILDNLMALNITMLENDKYSQQSAFVQILEDYAKAADIHIIFVAHPRKAMGFLRLDDVSGSGDIVNRVDNAFIMHRVNEDFKRLSKQMFKWSDDSTLYHCDNVLEICKDRASGCQDVYIPLFFDMPSKRMKNSSHEYKNYGWKFEPQYEEVSISDDELPFM